ncbi:MAG: hypothetical protein IPN90_10315 [Elusimicrobia bacterium]|nr:hypothetical protein [Elusimicrobiota bacterium]
MKNTALHGSRIDVWVDRVKTYARFLKLEHTLFLCHSSLGVSGPRVARMVTSLVMVAGAGARWPWR